MHDRHTPVLIVGGGLTGLSTALFLAWHGVRSLLVERHPDLLIHPRLRGVNPRSMELFRQVGLEPDIRAATYADPERFEWHAVLAETLASDTYVPATDAVEGVETGEESPCRGGPIDQDKLEILLRARARALGADVRFSTELVSFTQDEEGVAAVLRDRRDGATRTLRADYLVAADGSASPIRAALGVGVDGPGPLFQALTAIVEADLRPARRGRPLSIAYLQQPTPGTVMLSHDDLGLRWVFATGYAPERGQSLSDFTDERVAALVRAAAGLPDVAVTLRPQIPGTDLKVLGFTIGAQVAREYRVGRVFLVGDAAHVVPPTGGFGGSTGIQDTHNLAWKLAAVLRGRAGPALLDTYHAERHPIGLFTLGQALARTQARMGIRGVEPPPLVEYATVTYGYQYRSSAILGAADDAEPLAPRELAGQPGTRAPHLAIIHAGQACSTIDLYGRGWVLLAGPAGGAWVAAAERAAQRLQLPLEADRFGVELTPAAGAARHGLGEDGALLVRPDGFVAWRAPVLAGQPQRTLEGVLTRLLARAPAGQAPALAARAG